MNNPLTADLDRPVPFALTPKAHDALMPPADIHTWFGLSYANYLVLPRTLLQSMPLRWQHEFTALLDDLEETFARIPQAQTYQVTAAEEREVCDLNGGELAAAGITEGRCCYLDHEHGDGTDCDPLMSWTDETGRELDPCHRVLIPVPDPVPYYRHHRIDVVRADDEPRPGEWACRTCGSAWFGTPPADGLCDSCRGGAR